VVTGSPMIHCQLVFWDQARKQYYTYSVDDSRPVHVYDRKAFRRGWRFVALDLTEREELIAQNFCAAQLGKPLNSAGQLTIFLLPQSGRGHSWFCSELVAAALKAAGILQFDQWRGVNRPCEVAPHMLFHFLTKHCTTCPVTLMRNNPVSLLNLHKQAASAGKIELSGSSLPPSVTSHVRSAQNPPSQQQRPKLADISLTTQLATLAPRRQNASPLDHLVFKK